MDLTVLFKGVAAADRDTDAKGVEHMDTWKYIRRSVRPVDRSHHIYEYIIPLENSRAQIESVGEDRAQEQEKCHPDDQKSAQTVESASVCEEEISRRHGYECKPQQVWNDKILNKRNIVIDRRMNQKIMDIRPAFQINKPRHIDQAIQQHPCMAVVFDQFLNPFDGFHNNYPFISLKISVPGPFLIQHIHSSVGIIT